MSSDRIPFSNLTKGQKASRFLLALAQELQGPDEILPKEVKQFQNILSKADASAFRETFAALDDADNNPDDAALPDRYKSVYQASFDLLAETGRKIDQAYDRLPAKLKAKILAFSEDADVALQRLEGGATQRAKILYFLVSAGLIGASEAGIANSLEAAFKIRASATNAMWLVEVIAIATSPTGNLQQFIHALVMRLGVGAATQVVGAIRIFVHISDDTWIRPAVIVSNLAAITAYVIAPTVVKIGQNVAFRRNAQRLHQIAAADREAQLTIDLLPFITRHMDILQRLQDAEDLHTPNNSTKRLSLAAKTARKRVIDSLQLLLKDADAAQLPTSAAGASKVKKLPSGLYIMAVVGAQLGSSYGAGNTQTFADNISFALFIFWIYGTLLFNKSASPMDTQVEVTAYSSGMLLAVFCAAGVMLSQGQDVFEKQPELLQTMAITIVILNLTVVKQFIPFFELLMNPKAFVAFKTKDWARKLSLPAENPGPAPIALADLRRGPPDAGASDDHSDAASDHSDDPSDAPEDPENVRYDAAAETEDARSDAASEPSDVASDASSDRADVRSDAATGLTEEPATAEWRRILEATLDNFETYSSMERDESEMARFFTIVDDEIEVADKPAALRELERDAKSKPQDKEMDDVERTWRDYHDKLSLADTASFLGVPLEEINATLFNGVATDEELTLLRNLVATD